MLWIEAIPEKLAVIKERIKSSGVRNHEVTTAVVWSEPGKTLEFFRSNNGESSSVYEMKQHLDEYPEILVVGSQEMTSVTLVELIPQRLFPVDLLNLDIQGAELEALRGLGSKIHEVKAIYCEVNLKELYQGAPLFTELCDWLHERGFSLADIVKLDEGWGDGLWLNNDFHNPKLRRIRRYLRIIFAEMFPVMRAAARFLMNATGSLATLGYLKHPVRNTEPSPHEG